MVKRIIIGQRGADTGIFVSKPGIDVDLETKPLLLDTRYELLQIHKIGKQRFSGYTYSANGITVGIYWARVSYTSLGFTPWIWGSVVFLNASAHGLPQNSAYYPFPLGRTQVAKMYYYGHWVSTSTLIICKFSLNNAGGGFLMDFRYTIFKNAVKRT